MRNLDRTTAFMPATALVAPLSVVMCEPTHFAVSYAINPWMAGNAGAVDAVRAHAQWQALHDAIASRVPVALIPPVAGLPDLPFTANAGVVRDGVFVPSRFRHAERRAEEPHFVAWFELRGYEIRALPGGFAFEGAGDVLAQLDDEYLWMGCGQRTDRCAADALSQAIDAEVIPLELADSRFYHLDTCFCPLPDGGAMYFREALSPQARREVEARIPRSRRIEIDEADACRFACNAVVIGRSLFANAMSDALVERLRAEGYSVECVDVGEFLRAGGGARCLTFIEPAAHRPRGRPVQGNPPAKDR